MLPIFRGAATALLTPFRPDGSIDLPAWDRLLERQLDAGIAALVVCGTTGEAATLTQDERLTLLRRAKQAACDHCPVIMGVGTNCTAGSVENAELAAQNGADALLAVTPYYNKGTQAGLLAHYTAIADASDLPVIIYNVPGTTGVGLSLAQFKDILSDDRVVAVKYTDVNYYTLDRIKKHTGAYIYSGADECFAYALMAGADGGIGTSMNYCTEKFIAIKKAFDGGDIATAQNEQRKINNCVQAIIETRGLPAMKYMTTVATGIDVGCCRKPFRELTADEKKLLEKTAAENL